MMVSAFGSPSFNFITTMLMMLMVMTTLVVRAPTSLLGFIIFLILISGYELEVIVIDDLNKKIKLNYFSLHTK